MFGTFWVIFQGSIAKKSNLAYTKQPIANSNIAKYGGRRGYGKDVFQVTKHCKNTSNPHRRVPKAAREANLRCDLSRSRNTAPAQQNHRLGPKKGVNIGTSGGAYRYKTGADSGKKATKNERPGFA